MEPAVRDWGNACGGECAEADVCVWRRDSMLLVACTRGAGAGGGPDADAGSGVIADMREERVLERVEANVLALLQGNGYGYGEAWGGFNVYVARWDITKAAERLEFTQFVAALVACFLSAG